MNANKLKQMMTVASVMMLLAACAAQPSYRAADESGYGYSESQLTQDQFRIHFRGRGDNTARAIDYAMFRASELTLEKGFDWFDVASLDTLVDGAAVTPAITTEVDSQHTTVQDCGILTCTSYYRPASQYQVSVNNIGNRRSEVEVIMVIRMGKGIRPNSHNSYDARELYSHLRLET
jgi:hypothetical protein